MQNQQLRKGFIYTGIIAGLAGIIIQFIVMLINRQVPMPEAIIRFFSFFTILSNCMVVALLIGQLLPAGSRFHQFASRNEVATAVSIYIIVVGVVYQIILRKPIPLEGWHRVADDILHLYIPLLMLLYWVLFVSSKKIDVKTIPYWLIYPAAYFVYTLLRGSIGQFYPYPFVNVTVLGYPKVLFNSAMLVLFFLVLSFMFAGIANRRYKNNRIAD